MVQVGVPNLDAKLTLCGFQQGVRRAVAKVQDRADNIGQLGGITKGHLPNWQAKTGCLDVRQGSGDALDKAEAAVALQELGFFDADALTRQVTPQHNGGGWVQGPVGPGC